MKRIFITFVFTTLFLIEPSFAKFLKIISLSPATTEVIFYINAENHLIANTIYCTVPEKAKKIEKIGGIINPNIEKIISLKPDIVIGSKLTPKQVVSILKKFNIPVKIYRIETIQDIEKAIISIGDITEKNGDKYAAKFRKKYLNEIEKLKPCLKGKRTLIIFSDNPIYTAGNSTFLGEIIKDAGGINIAGSGKYKTVSAEYVIAQKPDFIIYTAMEKHPNKNIIFKDFGIKTVYVNSTYLLKPGPYIIEGIRELRETVCGK